MPFASIWPVQLSVIRTSALADAACRCRARSPRRATRSRPHLKCTAMLVTSARGRDIARRLAAEQRLAEPRAGELDDIESGLGQRDADDFEFLALAGQRRSGTARRVGAGQDRLRAGLVDAGSISSPRLMSSHLSRPRRRRPCAAIWRSRRPTPRPCRRLPADRQSLAAAAAASTLRTVTGSTPPSFGFEDAEIGGELHQRRRLVEADVEREALGVGELAPALVGDIGGECSAWR